MNCGVLVKHCTVSKN